MGGANKTRNYYFFAYFSSVSGQVYLCGKYLPCVPGLPSEAG